MKQESMSLNQKIIAVGFLDQKKNKYWTQSLHIGKGRTEKHQFFNPIIQNKVHIKWLKNF